MRPELRGKNSTRKLIQGGVLFNKIHMRSAVMLALCLMALFLSASCGGNGNEASTSEGGKIKVVASFYPMAEFARQIGKDKVEVTTLISPGVEPHDYDPMPQDIAGIHKSRMFVYNGAGLEPWADRIGGDAAADGVTVVSASDGIDLMTKDPGSGAGSASSPQTSSYDPHVWLDPVLAAQEVDNIKNGLIQADPGNRAAYETNANDFKSELNDLDNQYRHGLADCARNDIVTSHQAFKYLANRYGLNVVAIAGLSPDEEPSPQKLAEVSRFARANNVEYIFFETLVSPKLSETIASEIGVKTLVFNPLEGLTDDEIALGQNYISVQKENLDHLRLALDCK